MTKPEKILEDVVAGRREERVRGSHHIFTKSGIEELVNLQREGAKAKTYQVKQVRRVILQYRLKSD